MEKISRPEIQRIPELDGLRGIAILLVLSFHYLNNQLVHATGKFGKLIGQVTSFGWVGVDLFFVLSGFLIGSNLIRNRNSANYFPTFYMRRVVRIIPNYYLLLVIFLLITAIPYFQSSYFLTGSNVVPWKSYFLMVHNIDMAHMHSFGNSSLSVTWSIGIEEQFYIIFPFIVYFLKEQWLPLTLILAIIIAPIIRMQYDHWVPQYVLLPCRMDAIAFGALIACYDQKFSIQSIVRKRIKWFAAILIADVALCAFLFVRYNDLGPIKNTLFALIFSGGVVLALTYKNSFYGNVLRNKVLMWVGTISYSLYLFHYLILGMFQFVFAKNDGLALDTFKDITVSIAALIFSLFFSWFIYKKLETPFVKWGKQFKY